VFADARLVTAAALLIQVTGFAKTLLIAHLFGASAELDGYYLALVAPSLIVGVVGGSLQGSFVTAYVRLLKQDDHQRASELVSQLSTLLILLLGLLSILLWLGAEPLMALLVLTQDTVLLESTTSAFRIVVFILLLNSVADYLALVLNSHKHFSLGAFSPLCNVLLSTGILALWSNGGQDALSYGLIAGAALQVGLLLAGLKRSGIRLSISWPRLSGPLRSVLASAATMALGILFANLNLAVDQMMASLLGQGAVSIIGYANRFNGLIVQLLVVGMGTVLLPHLAEISAVGRKTEIRAIYARIASPLAGASAIAAIVVLLASAPALAMLLGHGALSRFDIQSIATIWFWYTVGLLPMAWGIFLARYFQATGNLAFITRLAAVSVVANIVINLLLIRPFGLAGLAISTSLVYLLTALVYHRRFAAETGLRLGREGLLISGLGLTVCAFLIWAFPAAIENGNWTLTTCGVALSVACIFAARPSRLFSQAHTEHD
jgi:putative peptidoglycan lipid II flippase